MSHDLESNNQGISSDDLRRALGFCLGPILTIVEVRRRPSAYRTSFPIEEVDVVGADGAIVPLLLKGLDWSMLTEEARRAKPEFLHNPSREFEVYRSLLNSTKLGAPACHAKLVGSLRQQGWLLLERVAGRELYQVGEFDIWEETARWLAGLHAFFALNEMVLDAMEHLVKYDADFYRLWLPRALGWRRERSDQARLQWLAARYERAVEPLLALPTTFLHGEFYASNVLVVETATGLRVCPVDWEMAGRGPGLIDLAALTAGKWSDAQRTKLALAYRGAWEKRGLPTSAPEEFLAALDCCRLHLAVQWLGWSADWSPPPEHRHDWLGEAVSLAEKLSL